MRSKSEALGRIPELDSPTRGQTPAEFSGFGRDLNQFQKLGGFHNLNALVVPQAEQVSVATDEELSLSGDGTFNDGVIVGVGGNHFQRARNGYTFGECANFVGYLRRLLRVQAALELKLFGEFNENLLARDGKTLALAGRLNALVGIPQPPDRRKEDVRVEDNAGSPIHDWCRRSSTKASRWASDMASQSKPRAAASRRMSFSPSRAAVCHHWSRSAVRSMSTRCLPCGGSCFTNWTTCSSVRDSVAMPPICRKLASRSTSFSRAFASAPGKRPRWCLRSGRHREINCAWDPAN